MAAATAPETNLLGHCGIVESACKAKLCDQGPSRHDLDRRRLVELHGRERVHAVDVPGIPSRGYIPVHPEAVTRPRRQLTSGLLVEYARDLAFPVELDV